MKKIISVFSLIFVLLSSCGQNPKYFEHNGFTQGTIYQIKYESPQGVSYEREIVDLLKEYNASLSIYDPNSLISGINKNDPDVVVDEYFRAVFNKASEVNKLSNGIFDITVAPLVNFWGFGFTSDQPQADTREIDSIMQYVGMDKIRISGNKVVKDSPHVMLDMNAIAKGYSVDVVAKFMAKKGSKNFMINIGGEMIARGVNASGNTWRIWIDRPADNAMPGEACIAILSLKNKALATSGNYRRFFEIDGVKYGHSINPKTGYPQHNNLLSASIVCDDCITADAWATTCMVAGLEQSKEFLRQHPELDALLVYSGQGGKQMVFKTDGLKDMIICE